jgi:hypothetical protein
VFKAPNCLAGSIRASEFPEAAGTNPQRGCGPRIDLPTHLIA